MSAVKGFAGRTRRALRVRRLPAAVAAIAVTALVAPDTARTEELRPFVASYNWIYSGMTVAVTTLELKHTGDTWTYSSRSAPRGIARLWSQRPQTVSTLRLTPQGVLPLSYLGGDGTSSSARSIDLRYDWEARRVTGTYEENHVDLALTPEVQDDSSIQVALMAALLAGKVPERFELIDKNSVREYRYQHAGEETLKTAIGTLATTVYTSRKAYSPRVNHYWCAPGRGYIPVRVQQKRGDDVEWTMEIQSLKRE